MSFEVDIFVLVEQRKAEAAKIRTKYPDRIPVSTDHCIPHANSIQSYTGECC